MARCKNVGGAPTSTQGGAPGGDGGDDIRPRRRTAAEKGKKVVSKK